MTNSAITLITPRAAQTVVRRVIPQEVFTSLPFWESLDEKDRKSIVSHSYEIGTALVSHKQSALTMGQHLSEVHKLLSPHYGAFTAYCRQFRFTRRTAYRYMDLYEEATSEFSQPVLQAAMARGIDLPGKYSEAIAALPPPPKSEDKARSYVDRVEAKYREIGQKRREGKIPPPEETEEQEARRDPDFLKLQAFRTVRNAMSTLGNNRRKRQFLESVVGMLMNEIGLQGPQTFTPEAVPDLYRRSAGRPVKTKVVEAGPIAVNS